MVFGVKALSSFLFSEHHREEPEQARAAMLEFKLNYMRLSNPPRVLVMHRRSLVAMGCAA